MLTALFALVLQTPPSFVLVDEIDSGVVPKVPGRYVSIVEARVVGRRAVLLLDTHRRGLPMKIEATSPPQSLLEFGVSGLGVGGKRIIADPESGQFAWVSVTNMKRVEG